MNMLALDAAKICTAAANFLLLLLLVPALALWVFIDCRRQTGQTSVALLWAAISLFAFFPIGFILYLLRRHKHRLSSFS